MPRESPCTDYAANPVTTDQRSYFRPAGSGCDIGAFEFGASAYNTPVGEDVLVRPTDQATGQPSPVTLTFASITGAGETTVTSGTIGQGSAPGAPTGFRLGAPPTYYDIATTATFTGAITICISYTGVSFPNEQMLKLLHRTTSGWQDVTTSVNTTTQTVCGETNSFSPFLVAQELYDFSGFFAPVDNLPTVNVAKAGSAIPVKFRLGGDQGLSIFASGYPRSQAIICDAGAPQGPVEETVTAGSSSLAYDAATERYTYVWKTEKAWGNSCRTLTLQFTDGTTESASFRFTR